MFFLVYFGKQYFFPTSLIFSLGFKDKLPQLLGQKIFLSVFYVEILCNNYNIIRYTALALAHTSPAPVTVTVIPFPDIVHLVKSFSFFNTLEFGDAVNDDNVIKPVAIKPKKKFFIFVIF
jgi:hypothetical protein